MAGQDKQDWPARKGQTLQLPGQESQDRSWDRSQNRTARKRQPEQAWLDRTNRIGLPGKDKFFKTEKSGEIISIQVEGDFFNSANFMCINASFSLTPLKLVFKIQKI
jgi:hypothetical protein